MSTDKNEAGRLADAPERIWLQVCDDAGCVESFAEHDGVTWCQHRINDTDIEYVRADRIAALEAENAEWRRLRDPQTLHANLLRGLPAQLTLEQRRHLAGNDERIAALEAALEQARADMVRWYEAGYPYGVTTSIDRIDALRKIGEVRK